MDYPRYLRAKRSIDERSLNRHVFNKCIEEIHTRKLASEPLSILEVGGGIGTMATRLQDHMREGAYTYTLIDVSPANIEASVRHIESHANSKGYRMLGSEDHRICVTQGTAEWAITCEHADVYDFIDRPTSSGAFDVIIGQAFLDLFDLEEILETLLHASKPGGLLYFPITYDGVTYFSPPLDPELDRAILAIYHASMQRGRSDVGGATTGRDALATLPLLGATILVAGGSDWVIHPTAERCYLDEDAYFLGCILGFVEDELRRAGDQAPAGWPEWIARRRAQLREGSLIYLAHQLDMLAQAGPA